MSKYKRDDKEFKAQVAALADSGLKLHVGANCSLFRARPCNECGQPANIGGVPAYVRISTPAERVLSPIVHVEPPTRRGHFNLPGFVIGLIYGAVIVGAIVGAFLLAASVGGVR